MITIFRVKALTDGQMAGSSQETGLTTKCMGMECLSGVMEGGTRVSTSMIKKKDKALLSGLMAGST
jgi:hypothetical protein